jgi:hypothetical protein
MDPAIPALSAIVIITVLAVPSLMVRRRGGH